MLGACAIAIGEKTMTKTSPLGTLEYVLKYKTENNATRYSVTCKNSSTQSCLLYMKDQAPGAGSRVKLAIGESFAVPAGTPFCVQVYQPAAPNLVMCTART
jgi:hypothetical protein